MTIMKRKLSLSCWPSMLSAGTANSRSGPNVARVYHMEMFDLSGRKGLVVGIANEESLARSAAKHFREAGAELAITYYNDKAKALVARLAENIAAAIILPCNASVPGQLEAVLGEIGQRLGRLDFLFHSIASAGKEDLHGRLTDLLGGGIRPGDAGVLPLVHPHGPVGRTPMTDGGSLMTLSYYGAEKVVEHYNVMGPVKAALEASVRYLAHELGPSRIRVNAIPAGPFKPRAASGITHFDELLNEVARKAPQRRVVGPCEVARVALLLASPYTTAITGEVIYVDAG